MPVVSPTKSQEPDDGPFGRKCRFTAFLISNPRRATTSGLPHDCWGLL